MDVCRKCLENGEKPVKIHLKIPAGICPVCYIRYGKFISICKKGF